MDIESDPAGWAVEALRDGVPPLWVAETIGSTDQAVRKLAADHGVTITREWAGVSAKIRETHRIAMLHYELSPKATR